MKNSTAGWKNIFLFLSSALLAMILAEFLASIFEKMSLIDTDLQCDAKDVATTNSLIHPYLGYLSTASDQIAIEESRVDSSEGEVVVGVFGGSVASIMATGSWIDTTLEQVLQSYTKKKVRVLNFAQGGGKQPQHLLALSYNLSIGQKFDYVVLVDGFNEAFFPGLNVCHGLPAFYPAVTLYSPIIALTSRGGANQAFVERYENFVFLKKMGNIICSMKMMQRMALGRAMLKAGKTAADYFVKRYVDKNILFSDVDMHDGLVSVPSVGKENAGIYGAQIWSNAHIAMSELSRASGTKFLHYIQPNQYVSKHKFSSREAAIAFGSDENYNQIVKNGYEEILAAAEKLNARGYKVTSLVDMFDAVDEQVYADSCCHYNKKGEQILQEYVARELARDIEQ
jgi:hypothetical protein